MRECGKYEITLEKFLNFVHHWTEKMAIKVIIGDTWIENKKIKGIKNLHDFYLSEDAWADKDFLLRYYADVPLWNLHLEVSRVNTGRHASIECSFVANCYFRDIRDTYLLVKKGTPKIAGKNDKR